MELLTTITIMGLYSSKDWFFIILYGLLGAMVYKLVSYHNSGKASEFSPEKFNMKYWLTDRANWNDLLLGFMLYYTIVRFKVDMLVLFPTNPIVVFINPVADSPFFYFLIGFLMTFIIKAFRQWTNKAKQE